jgi:hypothetical protein
MGLEFHQTSRIVLHDPIDYGLGLHQSSGYPIENNATNNPGVKTLSKIAKALGVSVDRLISEE